MKLPELRFLAAEQRIREAFHRLEEAELRQEPESKIAWCEAQYQQELATYARVSCHRPPAGGHHCSGSTDG
jgi:hypothetical protein